MAAGLGPAVSSAMVQEQLAADEPIAVSIVEQTRVLADQRGDAARTALPAHGVNVTLTAPSSGVTSRSCHSPSGVCQRSRTGPAVGTPK